MDFDLIIVGAGPAGLSTAYHAAIENLNVLLLEEHESIGEPVHCGECLSNIALQKFNFSPPESAISTKVSGIDLISENHHSLLPEKGVVLNKNNFEQWLADKAASKGVEIKTKSKVDNVTKEGGVWSVKSGVNNYKGKVLVDATGVSSFITKKILNQNFETVVGIQYKLGNVEVNEKIDFYVIPSLAPHGYLWVIPKSDGANVGLTTNQNTKAKIYLDLFLKKIGLSEKPKLKTFGGLIPASGPKKTFSNSFIAVGDAAGFTSPLFEGGTHLSLKSGQLAAKAIKQAADKNDFSEASLSAYESEWKKEFPDYSSILKGKEKFYSLQDKEADEIISIMPEKISGGSSEKLLSALKLLTKPGLAKKGALEIFKAFSYSQARFYGW
ncbi:MAG: NAD(P)/FAD-dependent oxidoreductase [Candidatus Marsarchaeota archaeon]|nr:NAD(P)/FAD-dependent oxidoreductase [Candidatus Marsarchaeota archaeon]